MYIILVLTSPHRLPAPSKNVFKISLIALKALRSLALRYTDLLVPMSNFAASGWALLAVPDSPLKVTELLP